MCPSRPYMTRRQRNLGKNTPFYTFEKARWSSKAALPTKKTAEIYPQKIGSESKNLYIKSKNEEDARSEDGEKMNCLV